LSAISGLDSMVRIRR